ncbi:hypothetical protein, conserved [Eimeria maxima]|uniref:Uncharacterized protein n=1 Tax=Eimeria maxima TaxID=5804 RepID=U6M5X9_EIMMA|nr:hypothetical protein, conserved [Eimeria maxima]CDJ59441.1 hypothetical protein, conserved [Eimeria maxima]
METLFNFLLQEDSIGEAFDPRAARPRCKHCGADAWLQWDGHYADYCSRSCRDKQVGTLGHTSAAGPAQRGGFGTRGPPNLLGERQAQLQQEKENLWEKQFSPRNRFLPRKKAQTQEQDPGKQQLRINDSATAITAGAFAEAAAAKKVARALRQRAPRHATPRQSVGPRMEGGPPPTATTPRRMLSIASRGPREVAQLQRQRTVARFMDHGEKAEELQTALQEYQENLICQRQKLEEERTVCAANDLGHFARSSITSNAPADAGNLQMSEVGGGAANAQQSTELQGKEAESSSQLLQGEQTKCEEQMKAVKEQVEQQLLQHKAQLAAEVRRIAAKDVEAQKALAKELGEVRASLQQLTNIQDQKREKKHQVVQMELEQQLMAELQQDLEQRLERKLKGQLQEELEQQIQKQLQRQQEQQQDPDSADRIQRRRSKEQQLLQALLEKQLKQEERLQQHISQQQRQQEKLLCQLQQQEQMLQRLAVRARRRSSARRPQLPFNRVGEIPADQQLKGLLVEGLLSHLSTHERKEQQREQQQQQPQKTETLACSWAERELALMDAQAAGVAAASEAEGSHVVGVYKGQLEAAVIEASLKLQEPAQQEQQQHFLQFGSKLQVVLRVATAPGAWEEKETTFSPDGKWGETFSFGVHWPSAAVAAASAALYAQLWATSNRSTATMGHSSSCCRSFLGEAALPLPTFTNPWEYRAPLRWRSSQGGNPRRQQLLVWGDLLLRVQFHPTEKAEAGVSITKEPQDVQALLQTPGIKVDHFSRSDHCTGSKVTISSPSRRSTDSSDSSSQSTSGIGGHNGEQLQSANVLCDVPEVGCTLQQQLLQQLDELSLAWWRALGEQQEQKQDHQRTPVVIDSQLLQEHLQRSPMMGALCTNSFCSNMAGAFADLYSEEEFRVWGICGSCQQQLFTTPLPAELNRGHSSIERLRLLSPFSRCCRDARDGVGPTEALARVTARKELQPFGELRLDGNIPVAFPSPNCLWPSALQLLHAQRFSLVHVQERFRSCSCSGELLALLQCPLLQRFERPDWHSRAATAVRTCVLLLLQQHPKLQLLLSSLGGRRISYHDPLQLRVLRRMEQQQLLQHRGAGRDSPSIIHKMRQDGTAEAPAIPHNFAGMLLMDMCTALGPPLTGSPNPSRC